MSPRKTRRGAAKDVDVSIVSPDKSLGPGSKSLRNTRRTNKVHEAKSFEENIYTPSKVKRLVNNTLGSVKGANKKSKKKDLEPSITQDSLSNTINESKTNDKSAKKSRITRQNKSNKSNILEANSTTSEDELTVTKNRQSRKKKLDQSVEISSEDEEISLKSKKKQKLNSPSNKRGKKLVIKSPEKSLQSFIGVVTPKNKGSPLNISFSPDRSRKTPRVSPLNLGSPKSHLRNSKRALKVPRKLSIEKSPPTSENDTDQQSNSPILKKATRKRVQNKNKSMEKESLTAEAIPRASRSKNISKELKSIKSNSPTTKKAIVKKVVSPTKLNKSFEKMSESYVKLTNSSLTDLKTKKSPKSPRNSSAILSESLKSPRLVLSKISKNSPVKTLKKSQAKSPKKSPVKSPKKSTLQSPIKSPTKLLNKSPTKSSAKSPKESPVKSPPRSPVKSQSKSPSKSKESPLKSTSPISSPKLKKLDSKSSIAVSKDLPLKLKEASSSISSSSPSKSILKNSSPKIKESLTGSLKEVSQKKSEKSKKSKSKKRSRSLSSKSEKSFMKSLDRLSFSKSSNSIRKSLDKNSSFKSKSSKTITPLSSKKMPKIVLNLKKSPLKKNKSPAKTKKLESSSKSVKTPVKTPNSVSKSKKSPLKKEKSSKRSLQDDSFSPLVVIKKLSSPELNNSLGKNKSPRKSPKLKSPKVKKSPVRKSNELKLVLKNLTPADFLDNRFFNIKPKNTSTPREKVKRGSPIKGLKAVKRLNNQSKKEKFLEDESEPSMNETSLIHLSDVFDSDNSQIDESKKLRSSISPKKSPNKSANSSEDKNKRNTYEIKKNSSSPKKNSTYELNSPKTPGLLKKQTKNVQSHASETKPKKSVKVQFTSPKFDNKHKKSSLNRAGTPGHAIQKKGTPMSSKNSKTPPTNQLLRNKIENKKRLLSEQLILNKTPKTPINKRLSIGLSDSSMKPRRSLHESQIESVNRLSKPKNVVLSEKKSGKKNPSARKIPNFSEIHKKSFAKMESLVDLKERVEKRHTTLSTASSAKKITSASKKIENEKLAPPNANSKAYSRFGFKLRKNDAVDIISKKSNVKTADKKREDTRSALKGVRMNRRFELIMKSRNKV